MTTARVTDSGLLISPEWLGPLRLSVGDSVKLVATSEGDRLRKVDSALSKQIESAERVRERRRDVFQRLAE